MSSTRSPAFNATPAPIACFAPKLKNGFPSWFQSQPHKPTEFDSRKKLGGRFWRPPLPVLRIGRLSVSSCWPSSLSFWLPWFLFSLPLFMDHHNHNKLRLIECIESIKSEVKQKMRFDGERSAVRKSSHFHFPHSNFGVKKNGVASVRSDRAIARCSRPFAQHSVSDDATANCGRRILLVAGGL